KIGHHTMYAHYGEHEGEQCKRRQHGSGETLSRERIANTVAHRPHLVYRDVAIHCVDLATHRARHPGRLRRSASHHVQASSRTLCIRKVHHDLSINIEAVLLYCSDYAYDRHWLFRVEP